MIGGKLAWFILLQFTVLRGCSCLNSTQEVTTEATPHTTAEIPSTVPPTTTNTSLQLQEATTTSTPHNSTNSTDLEIVEIFQGDSNTTTALPTEQIVKATTNCLNVSSVNLTCSDQPSDDLFKTNYTTVAEAVGASESFPEFRLQNTAAIAAGVFLVSAVIGYFSCVGYRRFLQRKYGNSQILIGEEVYDTTDLRYFEI